MGWTEYIFRAFFVTFGAVEIISNLYHLLRRDVNQIAYSAKKQHRELPLDLGDNHFVAKAILMLIFGLIFLVSGLVMCINKTFYHNVSMIIMILFGLYGVSQGVIYRRCWRSLMAMFIYCLPLVIYIGCIWR